MENCSTTHPNISEPTMPSLTTRRQVKYTKADEAAIEAAQTIARFAVEFDANCQTLKFTDLDALLAHVRRERHTQPGAQHETRI